jgi:hypothetical protein
VESKLLADSSPAFSIGSSLIFEAVVLAAACFLFSRKDF